jgi:serine/threonine-protein kinase HipA
LEARGGGLWFAYARSYLARPDAVSLYEPELPLRPGWHRPLGTLGLPGVIRDAHPDSWGQRVVQAQLGATGDLPTSVYLLASESNRFGALDFQASATDYVPRGGDATMDALLQAADLVEAHEMLPASLAAAALHGTSIGGARPKATVTGHDGRQWIAKFAQASDGNFDAVGAEAAAMWLARRAGLDVAAVELAASMGRKVLLVERFDRTEDGGRLMGVSGLTVLGLDESAFLYGDGTYPKLVERLRRLATDPAAVGPELFARIAVNMAVSNFDDHPRNHAALWDGRRLRLSPAFDLAPQPRSGESGRVAMAYDDHGHRDANFALLARAHAAYGLTRRQAEGRLDDIRGAIEDNWDEACDFAQLSAAQKTLLRGRQFLNPATFYDA